MKRTYTNQAALVTSCFKVLAAIPVEKAERVRRGMAMKERKWIEFCDL